MVRLVQTVNAPGTDGLNCLAGRDGDLSTPVHLRRKCLYWVIFENLSACFSVVPDDRNTLSTITLVLYQLMYAEQNDWVAAHT